MPIGTPAMGAGYGFGIAKESSYGTAISTADAWFYANALSISRKRPFVRLPGANGQIVPGRYNATKPRGFRDVARVDGSVTIDAEYDDIGLLLGAAFGSGSVVNDSPVLGAHTHTFTLARTKPATMPKGATLFRDEDTSSPAVLRAAGGMINSLELVGDGSATDRPVQLSLDMGAQSGMDANYVGDALAFSGVSTAPWLEFTESMFAFHATAGTARGSLTDQSAGNEATRWSSRIDNNLLWRPMAHGGAAVMREPVYGGDRVLTLSVTRDLFNERFFDEYYAATLAGMFCAVALKLTSTTMITGSTPYSLDIYMPYSFIDREHPDYGGGNDVIPEAATFTASSDGSSSGATITLVNGTSTAYWT